MSASPRSPAPPRSDASHALRSAQLGRSCGLRTRNSRNDALRTHAGSVDAVADQVATARAAGAQVKLGHDAYGKLPTCHMIAALLDPIQGYGVDALGAAVDALQSSADALRSAASGYGTTDAAVRDTFQSGG